MVHNYFTIRFAVRNFPCIIFYFNISPVSTISDVLVTVFKPFLAINTQFCTPCLIDCSCNTKEYSFLIIYHRFKLTYSSQHHFSFFSRKIPIFSLNSPEVWEYYLKIFTMLHQILDRIIFYQISRKDKELKRFYGF